MHKAQTIPSQFPSLWLITTDLLASAVSLFFRKRDYAEALQVDGTPLHSPRQEHSYINTGRTGKLEGAEEVGYGAQPV